MKISRALPIVIVSACALAAPLGAGAATTSAPGHGWSKSHHGKHHGDMTKTAGNYTLSLKLLPAESFASGSHAGKKSAKGDMQAEGGAAPMKKDSSPKPNHHLVVFIKDKKTGKPVEDATVKMSYAKMSKGQQAKMKELPVVKMDVEGKGKKTMHYGNNVHLQPGRYRVHVTVNGKTSANFHMRVRS